MLTGKTKRVYLLAVLLGVVFLAAQMHCCVELNSRTMDSHVCPICSATGIAIATTSPTLAMVPAVNRIEVAVLRAPVPVVVLRYVAPRAPPAS